MYFLIWEKRKNHLNLSFIVINCFTTWHLDSFESLQNELSDGLEVLLEASVVLALLQRFNLQLTDGCLHALDVLT